MASDFSRKLFNSSKHYSGVLKLQGRVLLDSDLNEQLDIQHYRMHTETKDAIGECGVPKKGDSFKITATADGSDVIIAPGRIYVGGLLCELDNIQAASYLHQPYYPNPDVSYFENPPASPPASPPGSPPVPVEKLKDGTYIVYIDAWQREINYLDDPLIHEVALGEADTSSRLQNVWQVKLLQVENTEFTCNTDFEGWKNILMPPSGKLNVQTKTVENTENPCILPPKAGYQSLENQLYRMEVQRGGNLANCTFKWSRDNASVETLIEKVEGNILTVADIGKDEVLGFAGGQWVEVVDDESTLKSTPHPLIQIVSVEPARREITLSSPVSNKSNGNLKLRRWDQSGTAAGPDGLSATTSWIDLENGIQVMFSPGTYRAGDHWLCAARTPTGEVEWPPYEIPNLFPVPQPPLGVKHYYCKLALLRVEAGAVAAQDCRPLFPSLTNICAEDICFDNGNCNLSDARTVQEALDDLCHKRENSCTLVAVPGVGWEKVFANIEEGKDAHICFQIGIYPLQQPVQINNKGNLKLTGCGEGTQIIAATAEAALVFNNCKSIIVRDMYAETGVAAASKEAGTEHLNGTFTFINCNAVNSANVSLRCGSGLVRAANCISIRNEALRAGSALIRDCKLKIGHLQQGILLVNVVRATVENNTINVYDKPDPLRLRNVIHEKPQRALIRKLLFSSTLLGEAASGAGTNVKLSHNGQVINFRSPNALKKGWKELLSANPPAAINTARDFQMHVKKLTNRLLVDETFRSRFTPFRILLEALFLNDRAVGSQGITIGGQIAKDIHIQNNTIEDVMQGIHVGLSNRGVQNAAISAGDLVVTGNTIKILLSAAVGNWERHGIFAGNCTSMSLENNTIRIERLVESENLEVDGIRVWGVLGPRLMVSKNFLTSLDGNQKKSFTTGININPLDPKPPAFQWLVVWNVAPSIRSTVRAVNGAVSLQGTNVPA